MPDHPLAETRAQQEGSAEKARWSLIVREHIARTLLETGYFHADDIGSLGVPEQHAAIIGSQTAAFAARRYMVAVGRRKCLHKAANGRKASIFQITEFGRQELVGLSAGVPKPQGPDGRTSPLSASAQSDGSSGAMAGDAEAPKAGPVAPEPSERLFEPSPGEAGAGAMFDPWDEAA